MKSLYEVFTEIGSKKSSWCYYKNANIYEFTVENLFESKERSTKKWIERYLDAGSKLSLLSGLQDKMDNLQDYRIDHVVSAYLLGVYLNKQFAFNSGFDDPDVDFRNPWLYTWFLTCLYHDIGYVYEDNSGKYRNQSLFDLLSEKLTDAEKKELHKLKYYALSKKYFSYRKGCGVIDHGVVGGMRLCLSLFRLFQEHSKDELDIVRNTIFAEDTKPFQKQAADAIIRHNMWTARDEKMHICYEEKGLGELNDNRISKSEHFTFLLSLCDTIEPIKRFWQIKRSYLLKAVSISAGKTGDQTTDFCAGYSRCCKRMNNICPAYMFENYITVKIFDDALDEQTKEKYLSSIRSLSDWVDVGICKEEHGNAVTILF